MTTVTVTINDEIKQALEEQVRLGWFGSINEALKEGARLLIKRRKKQRLTVNGFTKEFEDLILKSAEEPVEVSEKRGVIETEEDLKNFITMVRESAKKYKV